MLFTLLANNAKFHQTKIYHTVRSKIEKCFCSSTRNQQKNKNMHIIFLQNPVLTDFSIWFPDPHVKTFNGQFFSFHGQCDLVLNRNKIFESGSSLAVHVRTTGVESDDRNELTNESIRCYAVNARIMQQKLDGTWSLQQKLDSTWSRDDAVITC